MQIKDIKKLEEQFWTNDYKDIPNLRTFNEILIELSQHKLDFDKNISSERIEINFEEAYENIAQLSVLDKKDAKKIIDNINFLSITSPSTIQSFLDLGIYNAGKESNMGLLNDSLFTRNRLSYGLNIQSIKGYNHSGEYEDVIYAFAGFDLDLVKKYLPESLGLPDKNTNNFLRPACCLIMTMIYKRKNWIDESTSISEKFMNLKSAGKYDILAIRYFLSLLREDINSASLLLQEIADVYTKTSWLFNFRSKMLKFWGGYVHGLYNFAYFVLPPDKFEQLKRPKHNIFWEDFSLFQIEHGCSKGKNVVDFDASIEGLNELFQ